jgi:glycerol-3-phosphate dehydrogenase
MIPKQDRAKTIAQLAAKEFDLLVIGGGASGVGAALDAAQRGLRVALIERGDWAEGTSSRSTKLLHGGVRYLEQAFKNLDFKQLRQVRHGLHERKTVIEAAPFLAYKIKLVTPVFHWFEGLYLSIGLKLYGLIAGRADTMPPARWINKAAAFAALPGLKKRLHSAVEYYDGQFDDARYVVLMVRKAQSFGAVCLNHLSFSAFGLSHSGAIHSAQITDSITGAQFTIRTQMVLNCTGPFSDTIRLAANTKLTPRIAASKGVHLTLPLPKGMTSALMIPKTPDGRVLFAIPFQNVLMVGTTDTPYNNLAIEPLLEASEVDFLLETLNAYFEKPFQKTDVLSGFGGLRPLISEAGRGATKQLLRDHEVEYDPKSQLVSLLGGKWTTYRLMAQDAVDEVCRLLNQKNHATKGQFAEKGKTTGLKMPGADGYQADQWHTVHTQAKEYITEATAQHLHAKYGTLAHEIVALGKANRSLFDPILENEPYIKAEIVYQMEHEMALYLSDVLARRLRLEIMDWQKALHAAPVVARVMADYFAWTDAEMATELSQYQAKLQANIQSSQSA